MARYNAGALKHQLEYQQRPPAPRRVPFWWRFVYDPLYAKWWLLLIICAFLFLLIYYIVFAFLV